MKQLTNNKGNTLIELVMVMLLMVLFGVTIYTLIFAGSQTQQRLQENKEAQADARIALNYVNVRLRQNDAAGKIRIVTDEETGRNAIAINEFDPYEVWIFFHEYEHVYVDEETGEEVREMRGELREAIPNPGEWPDPELSLAIISAEDFRVDLDPQRGTVTSTVFYMYDGKIKEMSATLYLNSLKAE